MIAKPLVSIIVPCYNAEPFIRQCIASVQQQDYQHWECILIDDGSQDRTLDFLKSYASSDDRFKIFTQKNAGLSATRNRGIDLALGDFLYFLDSDDVLTANAISSLVSAFDDNDVITAVTVACTFPGAEANKISLLLHPRKGSLTFENKEFEVLLEAMETGLTPVAQNRLYRKSFIDCYNLRFKRGILHEDELWFFEVMLVARNVKFVCDETYLYRIDNQYSITNNVGDRNLDSYIQIMQEITARYSTRQPYHVISMWYAVYIKKLFLDFAVRERRVLSGHAIATMQTALANAYVPLVGNIHLSRNSRVYYKAINNLSTFPFAVIKTHFFRNPVNSLRKVKNLVCIWILNKVNGSR